RKTVKEMGRRHEALRSRFVVKGGEPVAEIAGELNLDIEEVDLRSVAEGKSELEARRLGGGGAITPFDLSHYPVGGIKLLQLEEQEHVLVVNMHHIVSDGWSSGIMMREFSRLYGAYVRGEKSPLPELEIQYGDYAMWQQEWLQGEVLEEQLGYWRQQLAGV